MSNNLTITLSPEVKATLVTAAKRAGVSQSAMIAQLIMRSEVEYQTSKLISSMDLEQLKMAIAERMNPEKIG